MIHERVHYCVVCYQKHKPQIHQKAGSWKAVDPPQPNAKKIVVHIGVPAVTCEWCKKPCKALSP